MKYIFRIHNSKECLEKGFFLSFPKKIKCHFTHVNNYFNIYVCFCPFPCVSVSAQKLTPILAVVSQNVTPKSCLGCVYSWKYSLWVTLRIPGSMRQDKPKLWTSHYWARWSQVTNNKTYFNMCLSSCVRKHM